MLIKTAEILCVGTEILIGDIVNTNAAYISQRLASLGISQYHQGVVGDNAERLKKYLRLALETNDLVILTGGLGPTYDDMTKETVCEELGAKLVMHGPSLERIKTYFVKRNKTMTPNNEKQALLPENCIVFENDWGTAPGFALCDEEKQKTVVVLPGPPREMKPMFEKYVFPLLEKSSDKVFVSKNINIFGIGESNVEYILRDMMLESLNPTIAPYAADGECRLRITASGESWQICSEMCDEIIEKIGKTEVGKYIYGIDTTLTEQVIGLLTEKKLMMSVAESCTGGKIGQMITSVSGSSEVFLGGVISYANEIKRDVLGVSGETLEKYGAVSAECASEMANGVRKLTKADVSVSVTGIAGPNGGTEEKPVGTVYISVCNREKCLTELFRINNNGREYVRTIAAKNAMFKLYSLIREM